MFTNYEELQSSLNCIKIKKSPKTFLQIIDKSYDEVLISKLVAYYLDERNTSRDVIKQILSKTKDGCLQDFISLLESSTFESIRTEESISPQSRLDIIIKYSEFWIVIENKINAWESKENQTSDYEKHIKSLNTQNIPVKYLYLKPTYNKSIPSNKNFSIIYYDDLLNILKSIKPEALTDKESEPYLKDFIKHMEEYLMKNDQFNFDEENLQFYLNNKSKIDYLINNYKSQCANVKKILVDNIKAKFPNFLVHDTASYIQIFKQSWENKGSTGIHFEIIPTNTNFDNLLGDKVVKLRYAIHNEKNTKNKYTDIIHRSLYTKEYMFNNSQNIELSISGVLEELRTIIARNTKQIDTSLINHTAKH